MRLRDARLGTKRANATLSGARLGSCGSRHRSEGERREVADLVGVCFCLLGMLYVLHLARAIPVCSGDVVL